MTTTEPFDDTKLRYPVTECLSILGVSRKHFYAQVKAGRYVVVKDGSRVFMTKDQLMAAAAGQFPKKEERCPDCGHLSKKRGHTGCKGRPDAN